MDDRPFYQVAVLIGLVATVAFLWMITLGRADLGQTRVFANMFDLQARAMFRGRLSVPDQSLFMEGFVIDGRTYTYFGIFPSLIRMPVLAVTDRLDGRMTAVSMLVAYLIALWSSARIIASVRGRLHLRAEWNRRSLVLGGSLFAVLAAGSNLFFLSSGAWVYHEASLWGAAGVLASFAATLRFLDRPRLRTVAAAGAWAAIAWTSRGSVGLAPSIVLGLTGLRLLGLLGPFRWLAPPPTDLISLPAGDEPSARTSRGGRRTGAALLVAASAGAIIFGIVNTAKFGSPTALPFDKQVGSSLPFPGRRAALAEYDGGLFSLRLIPPSLIQAGRPDLIEPTSTWPFVAYSGVRPPNIGGVVYDTVEPSSGLTDSSPFLVVLGLVGVASVLRGATGRRHGRGRSTVEDDHTIRSSTAYLRPFLIGGAAAALPPLAIAFIGQRYLTDALPLLVVASAAGVAVVDRWSGDPSAAGATGSAARVRSASVTTVVALAVMSVALTTALTWYHQRFAFPPDRAARADAVRVQIEVSEVVGSPPPFTRYAALPARSPKTGLAVVGDCAGLYWGPKGEAWEPIEVTPADLTVTNGVFGPSTKGVAATAPTCRALVAAHDR